MAERGKRARTKRILEMMEDSVIGTATRVSPEERATQIVKKVFDSLDEGAFRFPKGTRPRPKMIENA